MTDKRMQVLLELLPADAVFLLRRGKVSTDGDHDTIVPAMLWAPKSNGYVSEYNPWQAGFYTTSEDYKDDNSTHSREMDARQFLGGYRVQDDTPLAVLVDEVVRLRAALQDAQAWIDGGRIPP
jgi:hypothetical protein